MRKRKFGDHEEYKSACAHQEAKKNLRRKVDPFQHCAAGYPRDDEHQRQFDDDGERFAKARRNEKRSYSAEREARGEDEKEIDKACNNGAAGMPNFTDTRFGVITRISLLPSPHPRLYGGTIRGVYLDALAVQFDTRGWEQEFLTQWPPTSPAYSSYFRRIVHGPDYAIEQARGYGG